MLQFSCDLTFIFYFFFTMLQGRSLEMFQAICLLFNRSRHVSGHCTGALHNLSCLTNVMKMPNQTLVNQTHIPLSGIKNTEIIKTPVAPTAVE